MQCWGYGEQGIYLLDQLRGKWQLPELKIMATSFIERHSDVQKIFIEDIGSGTSLIQELERTIKKPFTAITRTKDKFSRAYECQSYVSSGYVFLNPMASYYLDLIGEITSFTADDSHEHDDQVDCMMDAINKLLIDPIPAARMQGKNAMNESISTKIF
jgi:predicted phage terminase large subunit-like protein